LPELTDVTEKETKYQIKHTRRYITATLQKFSLKIPADFNVILTRLDEVVYVCFEVRCSSFISDVRKINVRRTIHHERKTIPASLLRKMTSNGAFAINPSR